MDELTLEHRKLELRVIEAKIEVLEKLGILLGDLILALQPYVREESENAKDITESLSTHLYRLGDLRWQSKSRK